LKSIKVGFETVYLLIKHLIMKDLKLKKTKGHLFVLIAVLAISFIGLQAHGQGQPAPMQLVYKNWHILGESSKHMDVFSRVIQCETVNQVQLKVFNESNLSQTLKFKIEIFNTVSGESFSKDIEVSLTPVQEIKGDCDAATELSNLKIDLPATYNPMQINTLITFNP
jgi:hypothetical protein